MKDRPSLSESIGELQLSTNLHVVSQGSEEFVPSAGPPNDALQVLASFLGVLYCTSIVIMQ